MGLLQDIPVAAHDVCGRQFDQLDLAGLYGYFKVLLEVVMNIFENIRHPTKYLRIIYIFGTLFLGIVYYQRNKGYSVDDSFITYRYAYHLKEGFGLVFNVGERYYGTTAAGYAVILAMLSGVCDLIFQREAAGRSERFCRSFSPVARHDCSLSAVCI